MIEKKQEVNRLLVGIFNEILKTEDVFVSQTYSDLSVKEIHVIEAVCRVEEKHSDNRSTAIAERLKVTAGTLTISINQLEKKGYVTRVRDTQDRRIVHIIPTEKGRKAQMYHLEFHQKMVDAAINQFSEEETDTLIKVLALITKFFRNPYDKKQ